MTPEHCIVRRSEALSAAKLLHERLPSPRARSFTDAAQSTAFIKERRRNKRITDLKAAPARLRRSLFQFRPSPTIRHYKKIMAASSTPSAASGGSTETIGLRREVGLFGGISVLAGIMIGSGIFYIGGIVLERSGGNLGLALLVWAVGGLITLLSGICFAELGAMMPKAGGYYVYLREAYGERVAFMCGITNFFLSSAGSISALALAFAAAISSMVPMGELAQKAIALGSILLLTLINIRGIRQGSMVQNIFMVLKLLPIALIIICGLAMGNESPNWFSFPEGVETPSIGTILSMMAFAVLATLWAYEGWTNLNTIAEEIKEPKRNIPLVQSLGLRFSTSSLTLPSTRLSPTISSRR